MSHITRDLIAVSHGGVMPWWMLLIFFVGIPCLTIGLGLLFARLLVRSEKE